MSVLAAVEGLTYLYPSGVEPALSNVRLDVPEGDFALVAGPSAGGKSTLLRLFNGLVPQFHGGQIAGRVTVAGLDAQRTPTRQLAAVVGMVFQEPEAQGVSDNVEDEIAFGMEQHAIPREEMGRRLDGLLDSLGIAPLRHRRLTTLSGGERQRVAIASAMALQPRLLLLDEPTSQLDPEGAESVIAAVEGLQHERGLAVLVSEHRLERLLHRVDRVVEVEGGRVRTLDPRGAAQELAAVPPVCELARRLGLTPVPLTVAEALVAFAGAGLRAAPRTLPAVGDVLIRAAGLSVGYGEHIALRDAGFELREGEIVALVGPNGSGKSTLFRALTGLVSPVAGTVALAGRGVLADAGALTVQQRTALAGLVPQDPAMALFKDTVGDEVRETLHFRHLSLAAGGVLSAWNIDALGERNPRDLSVGQQQRVALAAMLAHTPRTWLLDEPTRGADAPAKRWLSARLREHAAAGGAAIVATHDVESAATFATRVIGLEGGAVAFDLPARRAFAAGGPLPTQVARLVPGALTIDEVEA